MVGARPWEEDPDPTPLHQALPEMVDHPVRVTRPMVRAGYHNAGPGLGHGGARRRTLRADLVGARARPRRKRARPREARARQYAAIYAGSYGWASSGKLHHPRTLIRRLLNLYGGATDGVGNYSCGAALVVAPHILGTAAPVGMQATEWRNIAAAHEA